jgi:hypothetical protein
VTGQPRPADQVPRLAAFRAARPHWVITPPPRPLTGTWTARRGGGYPLRARDLAVLLDLAGEADRHANGGPGASPA